MDGEGIKLTRKRLQKTQAEMAKELEVSRQSYIAWEKDTYKIPTAKLEKLLAMDASVPAGGLTPKETSKQERRRLAIEAATIKQSVDTYRRMRCWPQGSNHRKAMAYLAREGTFIDPRAYEAILKEFPDILSDPDGDYSMSKERSHAILGINPKQQET
jgi:DNA-binding XRE family transcriptional regulator